MNEKYAVEVLVPALGRTLEFMVPSVMEMAAFKGLVVNMISDEFQQCFKNDESMWLIDLKSQRKVPLELSCRDAGVRDGSRLMLVSIS